MKSFLQLIEEKDKTEKPVVMAFGRMNPPTTGHLKLIDKVKSTAEKVGAKHAVIVSHSQDTKKNPLSPEQKLKHLKRYAPGVHFESSSKEHPTILHQASKLYEKGHDHLVVVGGSDRVKEYHDLLHHYNNVKGRHGYYNYKKIQVVSAGHRDPDAEGAEGMSATKMREHAKNKDFSSFRHGVPSHVNDHHARELMHDVRKGMGLNESADRGLFKAIFVTGGPGSGKDIVIRECISESKAVELNFQQAYDYLCDKQKLSEKSNDNRRESIRCRGPLIINGPADDFQRITYIEEELSELGYETMFVFVDTTNEASKERNSKLSRMMVESMRNEKWQKSQNNKDWMMNHYDNVLVFENNASISEIEETITETYQLVNKFIEQKEYSDIAKDWLDINGLINIDDKFSRLFGESNVKKNSRSIQKLNIVGKYNSNFRAAGPADITKTNDRVYGSSGVGDSIRGDTYPRKDPNGRGHSGGAWSGAYSTEEKKFKTNESGNPTLKINPAPKESNFSKDNDKEKVKKRGDKSLKLQRMARPDGVGQEYDTRAGGQGAAAGAGLGNQTYSETVEFSNAQPSSAAMPGSSALQPNPLSNAYDSKKKDFKKFRSSLKEFNGFQNDTEMGVGGVLGGASNKEPMQSYKDQERNIGIKIIKKKKRKQEK